MKYACAFFLGMAVALASSVNPTKKLSEMSESETVLIDYAYLNSFAVDDRENMRIRLECHSSGWRAHCTFIDPATSKPAAVSLTLSRNQVGALDAAITPKVYGEDDIHLSGEHVIELHWSTGERHKVRKTGDDKRFMRLVWGMVSEKNEPNKAPEPTPRAVTIRAEPRIAPARVVAHL